MRPNSACLACYTKVNIISMSMKVICLNGMLIVVGEDDIGIQFYYVAYSHNYYVVLSYMIMGTLQIDGLSIAMSKNL